MKINLKTLLSTGLVVSSLLIASSSASGENAEEIKEANFQKWEYKITQTISTVSSYNNKLNNLGNEGWELVAVVSSSDGRKSEFVFKRPVGDAYPVDGGQ